MRLFLKNWSIWPIYLNSGIDYLQKLTNWSNLRDVLNSGIDKLSNLRDYHKFKRLSSKIDKLINFTNLSCRGGEFKVHPLHWTETVKKWLKRDDRVVLVVLVVVLVLVLVLPFFLSPMSIPNSALTLRPQPVFETRQINLNQGETFIQKNMARIIEYKKPAENSA